MENKKIIFSLFMLPGIVYFLFSFPLLDKYGITKDEPIIYNAGELHLEYLLTGDVDFLKSDQDSPKKLASLNLAQHPWHAEGGISANNHPQITPVLSALSCKIFFQKFHWLNSINAHHLPLLMISSLGISILAYFVYFETSNAFFALSSALFLGLFPRFFAMSHNNPVDAASAIAIMVGAASFYVGFKNKKLLLIFLASLFLGINFAVKANAVITVAATLCWLLIERKGRLWKSNWKENDLIILPLYFISAFCFFMVVHPYYWDLSSIYDVFTKIVEQINFEKGLGIGNNPNWNFTQLYVFFAVTPPIMVFLFPFGLYYLYKNHLSLFILFFFLFFWSLFRTCLPYAKNYDGIRHYIEIAAPLAVFSAAGLYAFTEWLYKKAIKMPSSHIIYPLSFSLAFLFMTHAIYKYFPHEIVYFNSFVGGAKQANLNPNLNYYAGDYWNTSSMEIVNWFNKNGENKAQIYDLIGITHYYHDKNDPKSFLRNDFIFPKNYSHEGDSFFTSICNKSILQDELRKIQKTRPGYIKNPACFFGNGYMVITNLREAWRWKSLYRILVINSEIVNTISREDYPIAYIIKANTMIIYDSIADQAVQFDPVSNTVFVLN